MPLALYILSPPHDIYCLSCFWFWVFFPHSPSNKCVELYFVFSCLSDLQISGSVLEYKWFYYVIKNINSTIKLEIFSIWNQQEEAEN